MMWNIKHTKRKLIMFLVYMRTNEYMKRERERDIDSGQKNKAITCNQPSNSRAHLYHDVSLEKEK